LEDTARIAGDEGSKRRRVAGEGRNRAVKYRWQNDWYKQHKSSLRIAGRELGLASMAESRVTKPRAFKPCPCEPKMA